jgi:hypothetical protein
MKSTNGSDSREKKGNVPHKMPRGTPASALQKNPQKMILMLCAMLWCSHGSPRRLGSVVKAL